MKQHDMIHIRLCKLNRWDAFLALLLGISSLALYIRTLAPGLLYGDSGELQTLAYTLGMSHPTGYPVYILLARLFTLLPFGDQAWRVNLFSAVSGGLTVVCIYLCVGILTGRRLAAVLSAVTLMVSPLFWFFSIITELYVPACAFLASVLLFLLLWRQTAKWYWLAASALLGGLSLGVHSSVALAAPGVLLYLTFTARSKKDWLYAFGGALVGIALAMLSFLALDARNADAGYYHAVVQTSLSVWGMTPLDFDSPFERLHFLYAAKQFNYAMFVDLKETMPYIGGIYLKVLGMVFAPLSLVLIIIGAVGIFFSRRYEALLLLFGWGIQTLFIFNYNIFDITVFFVPTFVFLALWAGIGLGVLMDVTASAFKYIRLDKAVIPAAVLVGFIGLGLTGQFWSGMIAEAWEAKATVFIRGTEFEEYPLPLYHPESVQNTAQGIVDAVEDDAIIFTSWDLLFPCYYVAYLEQGRSNLDFYETYPQEGVTRLAESALTYIKSNISSRSIYFTKYPIELTSLYTISRAGAGLFKIVEK